MLRVAAGEHPPRPMNGPIVSTSHVAWELCLNCWKTDPIERITMEDFLDVTRTSAFAIGPDRIIQAFATQEIRSIAYMPDGRHLVSGSSDGDICIWDSRTGLAVLGPIRGHTRSMGIPASVVCVAVSPDGRQIVSGGTDRTIRRWDAASGTPVGDPIRLVQMPSCITYSPDGHYFAYVEEEGIRLWTASGCEAGKLQSGLGVSYVSPLAFSSDSARMAVGTLVGTVHVCDLSTRTVLSTLPWDFSPVHSLAFSPDGSRLAVARALGALRIWNFSAERFNLKTIENSTDTFGWSFSKDGNFLLGLREGVGHIWDARTGLLIGSWPGAPVRPGECMSVSPDGRSMAACGRDGNIVVWDMFA